MDSFRVERPGTHLSGEILGRGPPVLVMPVSWGMDSHIYAKGFSALQGVARLILFDPRGVGDSGPAGEGGLSLDTLVDDAEAVRQHLGVPRWTILGHSNGGYAALTYALRYPDRVERLILLDTAASREFEEEVVPAMREHPAFPALVAAGERVRTEGTEDAFREMMAATFAMAVKDPERFKRANEELLERMRFSPARLRHSSEDLKGYDLRARLGELRLPTLVAAGRHDLIVPFTATEALARGIEGARFVAFEESGHWPFVEEREHFVAVVSEFLAPTPPEESAPPEPAEEELPLEPADTAPEAPPSDDIANVAAPEPEEIPPLEPAPREELIPEGPEEDIPAAELASPPELSPLERSVLEDHEPPLPARSMEGPTLETFADPPAAGEVLPEEEPANPDVPPLEDIAVPEHDTDPSPPEDWVGPPGSEEEVSEERAPLPPPEAPLEDAEPGSPSPEPPAPSQPAVVRPPLTRAPKVPTAKRISRVTRAPARPTRKVAPKPGRTRRPSAKRVRRAPSRRGKTRPLPGKAARGARRPAAKPPRRPVRKAAKAAGKAPAKRARAKPRRRR